MQTILILAIDGVMDSSLAITLDTLHVARDLWRQAGGPAQQLQIQTVGYRRRVHTAHGLELRTDSVFKDATASNPAWVIIPGLGLRSGPEITTRLAHADALAAAHFLQATQATGATIAASCVGVFLVAAAGLLEGRTVTTTWWLAKEFRTRHSTVHLDETRMVVRDGCYWTAGSAFSQVDLALAVITEVMGATVAHQCSRYLLLDRRPSQARYMVSTHIRQDDPTVVAAERWVDANLSSPISVNALSSALAVSAKTLSRRIAAATGVSPIKFIQRRRLQRAVHLIETTPLSIDAVAHQVGYQDATALRKLVKRDFGVLPKALR